MLISHTTFHYQSTLNFTNNIFVFFLSQLFCLNPTFKIIVILLIFICLEFILKGPKVLLNFARGLIININGPPNKYQLWLLCRCILQLKTKRKNFLPIKKKYRQYRNANVDKLKKKKKELMKINAGNNKR